MTDNNSEIHVKDGRLVTVSVCAREVSVWRANFNDNLGQDVLRLKQSDALRLAAQLIDSVDQILTR